MFQAVRKRLLADKQFRCCKFKAVIRQCLNKHLFYDLVHFRWQPAALCSNDAKSCYNRITLLAATLSLCWLGSSLPMAQSMITMLHEMEHHIQTTYGDSTVLASRATWQTRIAGIGQGNGAGPQIWAAVSSPMFDLMRQDGFYAHIVAAISRRAKTLVGFAFVDNTDLCIHGPHINSQNVQSAMQHSVDNWEGLLQATGGALIPTKCFWYLIDFQCAQNKWKYVTKHQKPGELSIKDDHHHQVEIPCLEPHKARQTLGVRLALDGNWDTKLEYLLLVTSDWKVWMAASQLSPADATFSLKNVIMLKLCYPLVTITFLCNNALRSWHLYYSRVYQKLAWSVLSPEISPTGLSTMEA